MAKSRWRRTWVKMWVNESLEGTIRFDFTSAERGVWYDLILMAGRCRVPGVISANETTPYPHSYIAGVLNIDLELLETTIEKCKESGRIEENEQGLKLLNWDHYQSEYERQKPYRGVRREAAKSFKECPDCHYAIDVSKATEGIEICPLCAKQGKEVLLVLKEREGKEKEVK